MQLTTLTPDLTACEKAHKPIRLRFRLLRWLAARLPRREIRPNGDLCVERYYLAGPITDAAARLWPEDDRPVARLRWLRRTWYLHRWLRADDDRHMHDHPWPAVGRVLAGAYVEETNERTDWTTWCVRSEGERTTFDLGDYHRVTRLMRSVPGDPAEVWTLMRVGRASHTWGYLVDGKHVPHQIYHAAPPQRRLHERTRPSKQASQ